MGALSIVTRRATRIAVSLTLLAFAGCLDVNDSEDEVAILAIVNGQVTVQPGGNPIALVVRAYNNAGGTVEGVGVSWAITSGGGSITPSSNETDDTGTATISYTPPAAGTATVRATAAGLSVTFNLVIAAASG